MATMNEKNILSNEKLEQAFKMFDKVRYVVVNSIGWRWHNIS